MIVKSKHTSCYGCKYNDKGLCCWFARPKRIPNNVINNGCNHRVATHNEIETVKIVKYIIDKFDGEVI